MSNPPRKIIIFDDDEDILSICTFILAEDGWEVFTFTDCTDVLNRVRSINPGVILMDNWIPETGGIVATHTLKQVADLQQVPVIYFTANSDIHSLAEQAGADFYIAKPFELDTFNRIIEKALNAGTSKKAT